MIYERLHLEVMGRPVVLDAYLEEGASDKDSVLIFPGGGYVALSTEREGVAIAKAYYERGLNAFVFHYSVGPEFKYPIHLIDASFAITYVKSRYKDFGINPDRIFTVGFRMAIGAMSTAVISICLRFFGRPDCSRLSTIASWPP